MKSEKGQRKKAFLIIVSMLIGAVFIGGLGLLFSCYAMDIKAEAVRLGIMKKRTDNYGTVLSVINDYNVVQAGKAIDLYNIPEGEKYLYIYKNLETPVLPTDVKSVLNYNLLLVNRSNKFKDGNDLELEFLGENKAFTNSSTARLKSEVAEHLKGMLNAAHRDGHKKIIITGAYRSLPTQKRLFSESYSYWERIVPNPYTKTNEKVAKPGYSEHHTGMAADIVSNGATAKSFGKTAFYKWMNSNSYKFGFVERYPKGKEKITQYIWESWHYRYVGQPFAKYLTKNKLTMEEFIEKLRVEEPPVLEYAARKYHLIYVKGADYISVEDGVEYQLFKLTSSEKLLVIIE